METLKTWAVVMGWSVGGGLVTLGGFVGMMSAIHWLATR